MNYKHRNSVYEYDFEMVNSLKNIYTEFGFDGYISPYTLPTYHHCFMHKEICIFYPINTLTIIDFKGGEKYYKKNIHNVIHDKIMNNKKLTKKEKELNNKHLTKEELNNMKWMKEFHKKYGNINVIGHKR